MSPGLCWAARAAPASEVTLSRIVPCCLCGHQPVEWCHHAPGSHCPRGRQAADHGPAGTWPLIATTRGPFATQLPVAFLPHVLLTCWGESPRFILTPVESARNKQSIVQQPSNTHKQLSRRMLFHEDLQFSPCSIVATRGDTLRRHRRWGRIVYLCWAVSRRHAPIASHRAKRGRRRWQGPRAAHRVELRRISRLKLKRRGSMMLLPGMRQSGGAPPRRSTSTTLREAATTRGMNGGSASGDSVRLGRSW
jgi:hypothetical protein